MCASSAETSFTLPLSVLLRFLNFSLSVLFSLNMNWITVEKCARNLNFEKATQAPPNGAHLKQKCIKLIITYYGATTKT